MKYIYSVALLQFHCFPATISLPHKFRVGETSDETFNRYLKLQSENYHKEIFWDGIGYKNPEFALLDSIYPFWSILEIHLKDSSEITLLFSSDSVGGILPRHRKGLLFWPGGIDQDSAIKLNDSYYSAITKLSRLISSGHISNFDFLWFTSMKARMAEVASPHELIKKDGNRYPFKAEFMAWKVFPVHDYRKGSIDYLLWFENGKLLSVKESYTR